MTYQTSELDFFRECLGRREKSTRTESDAMTARCEQQDHLRRAAYAILKRIELLAIEQSTAMEAQDDDRLMAADRQLEAEFGKKERAFGSLFEHRREHGC